MSELYANQIQRGLQALDGDTLQGIVVDDTYSFDPDHDTADVVTPDEVSGGAYTRLTATARAERVDGSWKLFLDDLVGSNLYDVDNRGGIVWVSDTGADADCFTVAFAPDPGAAINPYEPTWDDGLVELPIESVGGRLAAIEASLAPQTPLFFDATALPVDVDEVEIDLSDLDRDVDVVTVLLPDTAGDDVTAVLTMPETHHKPITVFALTANVDAQTAIKIRNPVFGAVSIAGGLGFGAVAATIFEVDISDTFLEPLLGSQFMWQGTRGSLTTQGTEYGILHTGQTEDAVDDIADAAAIELGGPVDPDLVALIKTSLMDKLDDGNQPVSENFAAFKAGLAVEALVKLVMLLHATADPV